MALQDAIHVHLLTNDCSDAFILTTPKGMPWLDDEGRAGLFQVSWARHRPPVVAERKLVFHGLRKTAVVSLLEAGCTDGHVSAITGPSRAMVEHYAKGVNQRKMAQAGMERRETVSQLSTREHTD